jgi:hypothetical protein
MASQRTSRRAASAKALQSIKATYQMWSDDFHEREEGAALDDAQVLAKAENRASIFTTTVTKKVAAAKFSIREHRPKFRQFKVLAPDASHATLEHWREALRIHHEHLRRRANRMVHSSAKLVLSRRLRTIMARKHVPGLSPVHGRNLSLDLKHSKVSHITRHTRSGITIAHMK